MASLHEIILLVMGSLTNDALSEYLISQQIHHKLFESLISLGLFGLIACEIRTCVVIKDEKMIRQNGAFLIAGTLLLLILSWDRTLSLIDGVILILFYGVFLAFLFRSENKGANFSEPLRPSITKKQLFLSLLIIIVMIILILWIIDGLIANYEALLEGDVWMAEYGFIIFGMIIALPNIVFTIVGIVKGNMKITIGLIIGSSIFENSVQLAIPFMINTIHLQSMTLCYFTICLLIANVVSIAFILNDYQITRREAVLLLILYAALIAVYIWKM